MKVIVKIYDKEKYLKDSKVKHIVEYDGVTKVDVVKLSDETILNMTDDSGLDPNQLYCILRLENGEDNYFRNSFVNVYKW